MAVGNLITQNWIFLIAEKQLSLLSLNPKPCSKLLYFNMRSLSLSTCLLYLFKVTLKRYLPTLSKPRAGWAICWSQLNYRCNEAVRHFKVRTRPHTVRLSYLLFETLRSPWIWWWHDRTINIIVVSENLHFKRLGPPYRFFSRLALTAKITVHGKWAKKLGENLHFRYSQTLKAHMLCKAFLLNRLSSFNFRPCREPPRLI